MDRRDVTGTTVAGEDISNHQDLLPDAGAITEELPCHLRALPDLSGDPETAIMAGILGLMTGKDARDSMRLRRGIAG